MTDVDDIWAEMQAESTKSFANKSITSLQKERKVLGGSSSSSSTGARKNKKSKMDWMENCGGLIGGGTSSSTSSTAHEKDSEIAVVDAIPMDNGDVFIQHLQRDINCLEDPNVGLHGKLKSLRKLELIYSAHTEKLSSDILEVSLDELMRPLLRRVQKDGSERIRQSSALILTSIITAGPDITGLLTYLIPVLVQKFGSQDLDGVAHLPEVQRPNPEQRPCEIRRPIEQAEEVRLTLAQLLNTVALRLTTTQMLSYIDEVTGLLRALCMDPFAEIKTLGCRTMTAFCYNHKDMLLHFASPMGRSLTSCLMHNHFRLRVHALHCLTAVLHCGIWKHNHEIIQLLVAWQDPNMVPVKSFYENVTSVNYFSSLTFDHHPSVRRFWFETLAWWLLNVPDKVDHEPHIFPYLLSGLFDENEDIALEVYWLLERCGAQYEIDNEKDLRDKKQYGMDNDWRYGGEIHVPFPLQGQWAWKPKAEVPEFPPEREYQWPDFEHLQLKADLARPRLGARMWVRTHVRRFVKALFNNVLDFRECNMENAAKLLIMCVAYVEDAITEWLQPLLTALNKYYSGQAYMSGEKKLEKTYDVLGRLLGAYVDPLSLWMQFEDSFNYDTVLSVEQRVGVFHVVGTTLRGALDSWEQSSSAELGEMGRRVEGMVPNLIESLLKCELIHEDLSTSSIQSFWAIVLQLIRLPLSDEQKAKVLIVAVALFGSKDVYYDDETDPMEKTMKTLNMRPDDISDMVIAYAKENFRCFRALLLNLLPIESILKKNAKAILENVDHFYKANGADTLKLIADVIVRVVESKVNTWTEEAADTLDKLLLVTSNVMEDEEKGNYAVMCHAVGGIHRIVKKCWTDFKNATPVVFAVAARTFDGLAELVGDYEYYKKIHAAVVKAERIAMGKSEEEDFATMKMKDLRETGIARAEEMRVLACETLLLGIRTFCFHTKALESSNTPDEDEFEVSKKRGSWQLRCEILENRKEATTNPMPLFFKNVCSTVLNLLNPQNLKATVHPFVVRPTQPALIMLISEVLRMFLRRFNNVKDEDLKKVESMDDLDFDDSLDDEMKKRDEYLTKLIKQEKDRVFKLCDDAPRKICDMPLPSFLEDLEGALFSKTDVETSSYQHMPTMCVLQLVDLNLPAANAQAPPCPLAENLEVEVGFYEGDDEPIAASLYSQTEECLKWNAALSLHHLCLESSMLCPQNLVTSCMRWEEQGHQNRVLLVKNIMNMLGARIKDKI